MERYDAVVVGGGAAGLTCADRLSGAGCRVLLLEAGPTVGGLARSLTIGGEPIEAYYHHIFPQDRAVRDLAERLGRTDDLEWLNGPMGIMAGRKVWPFDSPADLLRLGPLPLTSRLRAGMASAAYLARPGRGGLDQVSVEASARRWYGDKAYDLLWKPLLEAKFGPELVKRLPMAWLAARLRQRAGARKAGGDKLGYLRGSLGSLLVDYAGLLERSGVEIRTGVRVENIQQDGDIWTVSGPGLSVEAPVVVAALPGEILARLAPQLPAAYRASIDAIPWRGVICALVELDRPLSRYYWTNLTDVSDSSCVGVIEHTNLIDPIRYGGAHLVYLAHYVDPALIGSLDGEAILSAASPALRVLNPRYERSWVRNITVTSDRHAQPVPQIGGPMPDLPVDTGVPGLLHGSLTHIYPEDRGVDASMRLGVRLAEAALGRPRLP